ncbi:MAG: homocysteine S-methyltransferase family protein [Deltaproteobacteria bacterium]|jgi:homocysteine S-methyltransferase|nr:homocysteine S-methyltransferase family protein [Deltaproteobacteria bacterium]
MIDILKKNKLILMEGAIIEQLRRAGNVELHPTLLNAPLIYDEIGKKELKKIYQGYIDIAFAAEIPFFMCTPTWRADQSRVSEANVNQSINSDGVRFLQEIRNAQKSGYEQIKIGGLLGCKNDCYQPDEGLSVVEAEEFHVWQIEQLVVGGVDFLIAETLPNIEEATGIARIMEKSGKPYIISFVISRDGKVLDGSDLDVAVSVIDSETKQNPLGYMVNCAYPSFLCASKQPEKLFDRLIGYLANASSLDHCDLDNADQLEAEEVSKWGQEMLKLNRKFGVKLLGGCCGTGNDHLNYLVTQ